jgi:dihydroorotate dehydrogenase
MAFRQALQTAKRRLVTTAVGGVVVVGVVEYATQLPSQGRASPTYHKAANDIGTPLLRRILGPEEAHKVAIHIAKAGWAPRHLPSAAEQTLQVQQSIFPKHHNTVVFPNPIGLAAGFDKDGQVIQPLMDMGFGAVEIGSVTLQPQPGNPKPRMFRLLQDDGVINRYGFNSLGLEQVLQNVQQFYTDLEEQAKKEKEDDSMWAKLLKLARRSSQSTSVRPVLGINLGKNKTSTTPLEDYTILIQKLGPLADYLVVNISSPNTPGLRDMQQTSELKTLLTTCIAARDTLEKKPPLLVKFAPDLDEEAIEEISKVLMDFAVDGIILTNTSISRPQSLLSAERSETGGLSGKPIKEMSTECIRTFYKCTRGTIPIIGVGGISSGQDAYEKLRAGASVVQLYTGLVYGGPGLVSKIRNELAVILKQEGFRDIQDVIGVDHTDLYLARQQKRHEEERHEELVIDDE